MINPRHYLQEQGEEALKALLQSVGYRLQPALVRDLCHCLRTSLPWLISGPRGSGKTALAEALARACGLKVFYLQGMEGIGLDEVIGRWDRQGQDSHVRYQVEFGKRDIASVREEIYTREYFIFGDPLGAYEYAETNGIPPVLIIDEADKLTEKVQDMLLQLLGRGFAYVRGLGTIGVADQSLWPIVVVLSNDIRHELSPPFRSRCLYSYLPMPTIVEQAEILQLQCPTASTALIRQVAKVLVQIQGVASISDKPGPREAIQLLRVLCSENIQTLDRQVLDGHVAFLAKNQKDHENFLKATDRLAQAANSPLAVIDQWNEK